MFNYLDARHAITQALSDGGFVHDKYLSKQKKVLDRLDQNGVDKKLQRYQEVSLNYADSRAIKERKNYNILSIDGGGVRGIIPAIWLCEIEKQTKRPISHLFNLISGTSVGAIIAASLSKPPAHHPRKISEIVPQYRAYDLVNLFKTESEIIFSETNKAFFGNLAKNKYSNEGLKGISVKYLGDVCLSEALNDLVIPAVNQNNVNNTYLFNRYDAKKRVAKNVTLLDAVMASTAAPTYFHSYEVKQIGKFLDGGIHLNNPAMSAYTEALRYNVSKDNIFVLSLGTGSYIADPFNPSLGQGQFFWTQRFHEVSLAAQECNVDRGMYQILGDKYERWQVPFGKPIALDDGNKLGDLCELASQFIEELYESEDNRMNKLIEHLISGDSSA